MLLYLAMQALKSSSVSEARLVLRGRKRRSRPMAFSMEAFCQGLWVLQKKVSIAMSRSFQWWANSEPLSKVMVLRRVGGRAAMMAVMVSAMSEAVRLAGLWAMRRREERSWRASTLWP